MSLFSEEGSNVAFLLWLESTGLSTWFRESSSLWAYPAFITFHSAGLAVVVGLSTMVDLRLLGFAPGVPLTSIRSLYPAMWVGFWVNAISGMALMISDPVKMFTNPLFYFKMILIGAAVATLMLIDRKVLRSPSLQTGLVPSRGKMLAAVSLVIWVAATTAGRLTAYIGNQVPL